MASDGKLYLGDLHGLDNALVRRDGQHVQLVIHHQAMSAIRYAISVSDGHRIHDDNVRTQREDKAFVKTRDDVVMRSGAEARMHILIDRNKTNRRSVSLGLANHAHRVQLAQ
jgi:hypothetical protein